MIKSNLSSLPIFSNKQTHAIMFMVTEKYLFLLPTLMINLQETNYDLYDSIIIYHDFLTDDDCKLLLSIDKRIIFYRYTEEDFCIEHGVTLQDDRKYSHLIYVKYKIFKHLQYFNKVLFLDLDILIRGSLDELFAYQSVALRTRKGNLYSTLKKLDELKSVDFDERAKQYELINSGMLLVSDSIDYKKCYEISKKFIFSYLPFNVSSIDEYAIIYAFYVCGIVATKTNGKFNVVTNFFTKDNITKDAILIHFSLKPKIWYDMDLQIAFPSWRRYYCRAVEISERFHSDEVVLYNETELELRLADIVIRQKREWDKNLFWLNVLSNSFPNFPVGLSIKSYDFSDERIVFIYDSNIDVAYTIGCKDKSYFYISLSIDKKYVTDSLVAMLDVMINKNRNIFKTKTGTHKSLVLFSNRVTLSEIRDCFFRFYSDVHTVLENFIVFV